eukprot:TRINITY_DN3495_c0_g1_i1.p1 TRINITY_DN3495_c0_g1~~TRINITY_DN3495_c0_g1_i1.p1  ORF type:complete len:217 (-),score=23.29 TRINITY_DN3495_c0_g1_i1:727-1377(-)
MKGQIVLVILFAAFCFGNALELKSGDPLAQEKIDSAGKGATIYLESGLHQFNVNLHSDQTLIGRKGSILEGEIVINGKSNVVVSSVTCTSPSTTCVTISNSNHITVSASNIGTCGGRGIYLSDSTSVSIHDSYVHPQHKVSGCCDTGDSIYVSGCTVVDILGNVLAYGESNIELSDSTNVTINGNFMLNPLGSHFSLYSYCVVINLLYFCIIIHVL